MRRGRECLEEALADRLEGAAHHPPGRPCHALIRRPPGSHHRRAVGLPRLFTSFGRLGRLGRNTQHITHRQVPQSQCTEALR